MINLKFQVQTEKFSGPLSKLLELIEEKQLEITTINLAEVTADFLGYLGTLQVVSPQVLADFAMVASRLILIKSKALLPELKLNDEEEAQIKDFSKQLQLYKEIRNMGQLLEAKSFHLYSRPLFLGRQPVFYPPKNIDSRLLFLTFKKIVESVSKSKFEVQPLSFKTISLEEKIQCLINLINKSPMTTLSSLKNSKEKGELVVLFLAVLHLIRDRLVDVRQKGVFEEIEVNKL